MCAPLFLSAKLGCPMVLVDLHVVAILAVVVFRVRASAGPCSPAGAALASVVLVPSVHGCP